EEISFDEIKHLMDLDTIHSKKMEKILSEIYAKLTLYNLCSRIRNALEQRKKKKKYIHKLDFRFLIDRVREILFKKKIPKNLDDRIRKRTKPERPNRADKKC
ncbi:MAG: IS4/IS5 family transposase, partial [Allobaculum sp.]